ncbi:MAG: hypothetical protein GXP62_15910, partial [Oligoflexia bacterium]|nr:hypothetical protein [Oligoflexia bacterium]
MKATKTQVLARLREEQTLQTRAVLALVQLPPAGPAVPTAPQVAAELAAGLDGPVQVLAVDLTPDMAERLRAMNTSRDSLLRHLDGLIFVCPSGAAARFLRGMAPDLTATFDLVVDLDADQDMDWPSLASQVLRVHQRRFAELDLSGMVPHLADVVAVALPRVFQQRQLVPFSAGSPDSKRVRLLLAEPGAGKSVFLRQLACQPSPDRLRIYAPLSSWAAQSRERELPLLEWLEGHVGRLLGLASVPLVAHLYRIDVLLDGVDEVPGRGARRRLVDDALALCHDHPGATCLLASRDHVVDDLLADRLRQIGLLRLAPLDERAARALVEGFLRARRGLSADQPMPAVLRGIRRQILTHPDFVRFRQNPLLLTFLTVLADLGRGLPKQRAELYAKLVEMLIVSWQRVRTASAGRRLNRADVLRVVAPLGWRLVELGVGGLTEDELLDFLVEVDTREADAADARAAARLRLVQLGEDSALLHVVDGLWRFHHATIAEFLAARAVLQSPRLRAVLQAHTYQPRRTLVMAFALALACDLDSRDDVALPLLRALDADARRPGRYDAGVPRTLVTCLQEARSMPREPRQRLAAHVLRIALCQAMVPRRRVEALSSVAELSRISDGPIRAAFSQLLAAPADIRAADLAEIRFAQAGAPSLSWPLPWLFEDAAVDAGPLVASWIAVEDAGVRALAW